MHSYYTRAHTHACWAHAPHLVDKPLGKRQLGPVLVRHGVFSTTTGNSNAPPEFPHTASQWCTNQQPYSWHGNSGAGSETLPRFCAPNQSLRLGFGACRCRKRMDMAESQHEQQREDEVRAVGKEDNVVVTSWRCAPPLLGENHDHGVEQTPAAASDVSCSDENRPR
jgi:hypothetical protein